MRNFISIEEKGSVREFIINDLSNVGLRIDTNKHRQIAVSQASPHIAHHSKLSHGSRVFNVSLHQMDTISVRLEEFDLTVPIFLRWCFDHIRRSIKHEGLFRKSGGSQRIKELMARIEDGCLAPSLSSSNTVFDICSLLKEFLRRLTYPLITHPLQDLLLDCFSMRSLPAERKIEMYFNILLLLPDEHLHALIYILRFLHEITLHERENKMNAKNLAICVGPGIMRTSIDGKNGIMTEQCATNVSDIVETLIVHAAKLGYITDSIYDRSQMLLEMRQKEALQHADDSFATENGMKHGIGGGKMADAANAKKRRSGSVKEFLVHMTNRFRRRSGSNNDSRDHTNAFLDQSGKLSSSHTREHRYQYQHYQQNSINERSSSPTSHSTNNTSKRKSSDDPNGSNSKRGKTKTSSQEKSSLPNANRFTSPLTAFRRKKKTPSHNTDPGFPFKIEHSHLPQLLHFTDEVPLRFSNNLGNPSSSVSSSSSSLASKTPGSSMTTLGTSVIGNGSIVHSDTLHSSIILPSEASNPLLSNIVTMSNNNKSLDAKKINLLDSWKWPKSSRKAERKPLVAIHAPMLVPSSIDSSSLGELCPSPIKSTGDSTQTLAQQIGSSSLLMHSSFGVHRYHADDISSASFNTTTTFRPRRSISSSSGQQQTRHIACQLNNYSHSLPGQEDMTNHEYDEHDALQNNAMEMNITHEPQRSLFDGDEDEEETTNELNQAVFDGNEDAQSLRGFPAEPNNHENGSLDVAFIDETDMERRAHQDTTTNASPLEQEQDVQSVPPSTTLDEVNEEQGHEKLATIDSTPSPVLSSMTAMVLMEKSMNKEDDLDEILRRNGNRVIRLTDSDDEEPVSSILSTHRMTPIKDSNNNENLTTTPKVPVRISSSISSLLSSNSLSDLPLSRSAGKQRSLSCSLSQSSNDTAPLPTIQSISIHLAENDENISLLSGGRESILVLKDKFAGRVSRQVRAFEQRSTDNVQNRSLALPGPSEQSTNDLQKCSFVSSALSRPEEQLIEQALARGKTLLLSSTGTGEMARSVKRLQNAPIRRWKERATDWEKRRRLSSPSHLGLKMKKGKK